MKMHHTKILAIFAAVLLIIFTVYKNTYSIDWDKHQQELAQLREIRLLDTMINKEILKLQYQFYSDYTKLTDYIKQFRFFAKTIELEVKNFSSQHNNITLYKELLRNLLLDKANKIELFGATNAMLKKSVIRTPELTGKIKKSLEQTDSDLSLHHMIDEMEKNIFLYSVLHHPEVDPKIQAHLKTLKQLVDNSEGPISQNLNSLRLHILANIAKRSKAIDLTNKISDIKLTNLIQELQQAYTDNHQLKLAESRRYRITLYIILFSLLAYTTYILIILKRKSDELSQEKDRVLITLASIGDGVITTDENGIVQFINPVAEQLTGWNNRDVQNQRFSNLFDIREENTNKPIDDLVEKCVSENRKTHSDTQCVLINKNGTATPIEESVAPIRSGDESILGTIMVFRDVSDTRELSRKLSHQASHDPLTGIINRRAFDVKLKLAIKSAKIQGRQHALLYLDLDQFKIVNDTCGHDAGDRLLVQLTSLLEKKLDDNDVLSRLGGDEFGILLNNCSSESAYELSKDLINSIKNFKYVSQGVSFQLGVSIGLVFIDQDSEDIISVLSHSDIACYVAKEMGRNRVHKYNKDDNEVIRRQGELQWVSRLTQAIKEGQFTLYRQPIVPLSKSGPKNNHFELLLRLRDRQDQKQFVLPPVFIPAAERFNIMPNLDRWVIHSAFSYYAKHNNNNDSYSINLSATSLNGQNLLAFIKKEYLENSIDPSKFCFEITETAAIENLDNAADLIKELKLLGFKFALDDFGKGLSSFTYLNSLPVDYLKIEGEFVKHLTDKPVYYEIVKAVNHIGHLLGMETIAESVENQKALVTLAELGVDYAQGYEIGYPEPLPQGTSSNVQKILVPQYLN